MTFQNVQYKYTILQVSREENQYIKGSSTQIALDFLTAMQKLEIKESNDSKLWRKIISTLPNS